MRTRSTVGNWGTGGTEASSFQLAEAMKHLAPAQAVACVHFKEPNRGSSGRSFSGDATALTSEMVIPSVGSGMEEGRQLSSCRIVDPKKQRSCTNPP